MAWQRSRQVQRRLLPMGCSGLGQAASNPTALVFAWWVFLMGLSMSGRHVMAHVVLGSLTGRHRSFHSCSPTHRDFPNAEAGRIHFQIPFLRKSESRGLMEGVTLWKPICYLSASSTSHNVLGLGTGGICQWLCHLLAAREVVVPGTYPFSIATK